MKSNIEERSMRFPATFGLCACLGLSIGFGQRVDVTPVTVVPSTRLQLRFEVDPPTAGPGAQVFAKLTLKNISEKPVSIVQASPRIDYNVTVVDAAGREPERTDWGKRKLTGPYTASMIDSRLQPGEERQATVEITGVYKLSQPGTY